MIAMLCLVFRNASKLHSLGWTHKVEIEDGVRRLFEWYRESLK